MRRRLDGRIAVRRPIIGQRLEHAGPASACAHLEEDDHRIREGFEIEQIGHAGRFSNVGKE